MKDCKKDYKNCVVLSKDFYVESYGGYEIYFDKSKRVFFASNDKNNDLIFESCTEMIETINKIIEDQKEKCMSCKKDKCREAVKNL